MNRTVIDIESRSAADLRKIGTFAYAEHPTTAITHVATSIGVEVWRPSQSSIPRHLADALADSSTILVAHNFQFERAVMSGPAGRAIGLPDATLATLERWDCTAARAAHVGLPRDLAGAANALRLRVQKDAKGHALMLRVSKPCTLNPLSWWDDQERQEHLAEYCRQDVVVEAELDRVLPALSAAERAIWLATERLNDRGVLIDQDLLNRLIDIAATARLDMDQQIATLTAGLVPRVSNHAALTRWLVQNGIEVEGCSRSIVTELLDHCGTGTRSVLDPTVRAVLELRQDGGGSSSQKATAIQRQLSADGRVHGALIYGGAPATLRWSSTGAQLHNLKRHDPRFTDPKQLLSDVVSGSSTAELAQNYGSPLKVVSELLRPLLIAAPGHTLITADYAQIEARVLAWLAGQNDRLNVFRAYDAGNGPDLYRVTAARIYQTPVEAVTKDQRQIGKTADLALGYQGGAKAFRSMAKNFGLQITDEQAEVVKQAWRTAHPYITAFWHNLDAAACECLVQPPGPTFTVGRIAFRRNKNAMVMRLPSGRSLVYWYPSLKEAEMPWGEMRTQMHYWSQDAMTRSVV
jgi:DNA polymerase bacteriophage-type